MNQVNYSMTERYFHEVWKILLSWNLIEMGSQVMICQFAQEKKTRTKNLEDGWPESEKDV